MWFVDGDRALLLVIGSIPGAVPDPSDNSTRTTCERHTQRSTTNDRFQRNWQYFLLFQSIDLGAELAYIPILTLFFALSVLAQKNGLTKSYMTQQWKVRRGGAHL